MADDMSSIPPRVNTLEMEIHTIKHRLNSVEDTHRDTPAEVARLKIAVQRLPEIEAQLKDQGDMIKRGFIMTHGILLGAGGMWVIFNVGPKILQFMGAR
jgi:hypothetical protein